MGFAFRKEQTEAKEFLYWVLTEGQRYNHAYGFLKTEADHLAEQLRAIEDPRYASSTDIQTANRYEYYITFIQRGHPI